MYRRHVKLLCCLRSCTGAFLDIFTANSSTHYIDEHREKRTKSVSKVALVDRPHSDLKLTRVTWDLSFESLCVTLR